MNQDKPVTLKTLALLLGLTPASVSKALRDSPDISIETRKRVKQKARELGYHPNILARSLIKRRTNMLGIIVPDLRISFFTEAVRGIYEKARIEGYESIILVHDENADTELRNLDFLAALHVDGILIDAVPGKKNNAVIRRMFEQGIAFICYDRLVDGLQFPSVTIDDEGASIQLMDYFIKQGRRNILFLGPTQDHSVVKGRYQGYRKALQKHGLPYQPEHVVNCQINRINAYEQMQAALSRKLQIDAVMCVGGLVAYGAGKAIFEAGLSIPADIMLAEFGDNNIVHRLGVPFVTVDQAPYKMGTKAVELLLERIHTEAQTPLKHLKMQTELIVHYGLQKEIQHQMNF